MLPLAMSQGIGGEMRAQRRVLVEQPRQRGGKLRLLGRMFGDYTPSGGEWQRIALARTLARDAALLVLDEPTLHLDQQAERVFLQNLRALCGGRTVVLITHHPPLLAAADRVLFLSGGHVAEEGRHEELLARRGAYAALFGKAAEAAHSPDGGRA